MVPASGPDSNPPRLEADGAARLAAPRKTLVSARSFLLAGTGIAGLLLVIGTGVWLARIPLAESVVASALRTRGIDGAVELQKFDLGGLEARSVRLGPAGSATVETGPISLRYHFDWSTGRLSLNQVRAEGVRVRLATDGRSIDLGALAPLLEGPAGPRRVDIGDLDLGPVQLELTTPWGTSLSSLSVRGSDRAGWTLGGRAGIPAGLLAQPVASGSAATMPIGIAIEAQPGAPPVIGLAARPSGLDLSHQGLMARGLAGRVEGWVRLGTAADGIEAAVTALDLSAAQLRGAGFDVTQASVGSSRLTWRHASVWNQDGVMQGQLRLRATGASLQETAARRIDVALELARARDGAATLALTGEAGQLVVPGQTLDGVGLDGQLSGRMPDLLLPGGWSVTGQGDVRINGLALPLPALPGPGATRLPDSWQAQGRFGLGADGGMLAVQPLGPVALRGAGGAQLVLQPSGDAAEGLRMPLDRAGTGPMIRLAGSLTGRVDGAVLTGRQIGLRMDDGGGWGLDFADLSVSGLRAAGYRVAVGGLSGSFGAAPGGLLRGQATAQLNADSLDGAAVGLSGFVGRIDSTLAGPTVTSVIDGRAQTATTGGLTARGARLRGDIALDWQGGAFAGNARLAADAARVEGQGMVLDRVALSTTRPMILSLGPGNPVIDAGYRLSAQRIAARDARLDDLISVGRVQLAGREGGLSGVIDQQASARRLAAQGFGAETVTAQTRGTLVVRGDRTDFSSDLVASLTGVETGGSRFATASVNGPVTVSVRGGRTQIGTPRCLDLSTGAVSSAALSADGLVARLCPDPVGRLAVVDGRGLELAGAVSVEPVDLALASGAVRFGAVEGTFRPHPGGWAWDGSAPGLVLEIPLDAADPAAQAQVRAERASVTLRSGGDGITLTAGLEGISATGLPVAVAGSAEAELSIGASGLAGTFAFTDLFVEDAAEPDMFGSMVVTGTGTVSPTAVSLDATARELRTRAKVATLDLDHDITTGVGGLVADLDGLVFNAGIGGRPPRQGLQPADLVPPLRGLVGEADGALIGTATVTWEPDTPVAAEGLFAGTNLSFATLAGPFDQVSATVSLLDLFNPTTNGPQRLTIGSFNPGIPLDNGVVTFELRGDRTVRVLSAQWPFAGGTLALDPASIAFEGGDQSFVLRAEGIELSQFLELTQVPNLSADGTASGVLPVVVRGGVAEIVGGRLTVDAEGGNIRYTGPDASGNLPPPSEQANQRPGFFERLRRRIQGEPAPQGADLAVAALRNFQFKVLELSVDGRVTGDLDVGVVLEGANPDVLAGTPFRFNIRATGPMMRLMQNIARITDPQGYVDLLRDSGAAAPDPASTPPQTPPPTQTAPGPEDPAPPS